MQSSSPLAETSGINLEDCSSAADAQQEWSSSSQHPDIPSLVTSKDGSHITAQHHCTSPTASSTHCSDVPLMMLGLGSDDDVQDTDQHPADTATQEAVAAAWRATKPLQKPQMSAGSELKSADSVDGRVFLGGLALSSTVASVRAHCSKWGEVGDIFIRHGQRYGFVTFLDPGAAHRFLQDKHVIDSCPIAARAGKPKQGEVAKSGGGGGGTGGPITHHFVGGTGTLTAAPLRAYFEQYGEVTRAEVYYGPNGAPRGFGFVSLRHPAAAGGNGAGGQQPQQQQQRYPTGYHCVAGQMVEVRRAEHEAAAGNPNVGQRCEAGVGGGAPPSSLNPAAMSKPPLPPGAHAAHRQAQSSSSASQQPFDQSLIDQAVMLLTAASRQSGGNDMQRSGGGAGPAAWMFSDRDSSGAGCFDGSDVSVSEFAADFFPHDHMGGADPIECGLNFMGGGNGNRMGGGGGGGLMNGAAAAAANRMGMGNAVNGAAAAAQLMAAAANHHHLGGMPAAAGGMDIRKRHSHHLGRMTDMTDNSPMGSFRAASPLDSFDQQLPNLQQLHMMAGGDAAMQGAAGGVGAAGAGAWSANESPTYAAWDATAAATGHNVNGNNSDALPSVFSAPLPGQRRQQLPHQQQVSRLGQPQFAANAFGGNNNPGAGGMRGGGHHHHHHHHDFNTAAAGGGMLPNQNALEAAMAMQQMQMMMGGMGNLRV